MHSQKKKKREKKKKRLGSRYDCATANIMTVCLLM